MTIKVNDQLYQRNFALSEDNQPVTLGLQTWCPTYQLVAGMALRLKSKIEKSMFKINCHRNYATPEDSTSDPWIINTSIWCPTYQGNWVGFKTYE